MIKARIIAVAALTLWIPSSICSGSEAFSADVVCAGQTCFKKSVDVFGEKLSLRGAGTKDFLFLPVYDAALYLPDSAGAEEALSAVSKTLVIRYRRAISREKFIKAAEYNLKRNKEIDLNRISGKVKEMNALLRGVEEGDEYRLEHSPGKGTYLYLNDILQGRVLGDEFASAYFSIWLGDHVFCKHLRKQLLDL